MRGDPSRRSVAIVRCLRELSSLRTRAANSGSAAANSAHDATRQKLAVASAARRCGGGQRQTHRALRHRRGPDQGRDARRNSSTRTKVSRMEEPGPPAASPENAFAADLFEDLPPKYDRLAEVLSLRQNGKWRSALVSHIVRFKPRRILDVATGTAGVAIALAHATDADIVGVDLSEAMLERGRKRVYDRGLDQRIRLQHARAEQLPFPDASFDAISFTYLLRSVADPAATLAELARVLRPSGGMAGLAFYVTPKPSCRAGRRFSTRRRLPSRESV